jgi:hypothetical protein
VACPEAVGRDCRKGVDTGNWTANGDNRPKAGGRRLRWALGTSLELRGILRYRMKIQRPLPSRRTHLNMEGL